MNSLAQRIKILWTVGFKENFRLERDGFDLDRAKSLQSVQELRDYLSEMQDANQELLLVSGKCAVDSKEQSVLTNQISNYAILSRYPEDNGISIDTQNGDNSIEHCQLSVQGVNAHNGGIHYAAIYAENESGRLILQARNSSFYVCRNKG